MDKLEDIQADIDAATEAHVRPAAESVDRGNDRAWGERLRNRHSGAIDAPPYQKRDVKLEGFSAIAGARMRQLFGKGDSKMRLRESRDWMARIRKYQREHTDGTKTETRRPKNLGNDADWLRVQQHVRRDYVPSHPERVVSKTRPEQAGPVQPNMGAPAEGRIDGGQAGVGGEVQGAKAESRKAGKRPQSGRSRSGNRKKEVRQKEVPAAGGGG